MRMRIPRAAVVFLGMMIAAAIATPAMAAPVVADSQMAINSSTAGASYRGIGQSFTAIDGTIDSIMVNMRDLGSSGVAYAMVYAHTGDFGSDLGTGTPLATSSSINCSLVPDGWGEVTFHFDNSCALSAGENYVFVIVCTGSDWEIQDSYGGHPGREVELYLPLSIWSSPWHDYDLMFVVYENPPTTESSEPTVTNVAAVPDPQTYCGDVVVSADATDPAGIASVECSYTGGSGWVAMAWDTGDTYRLTIDSPWAGDYEVEVRATDLASEPNVSDAETTSFSVEPCQLSVAYGGPTADADGNGSSTFSATVSGDCAGCVSGAAVTWTLTPVLGGAATTCTAVTDSSGKASAARTVAPGVYDVSVSVADRDLGGSDAIECEGDTAYDLLSVLDPNAASTGGGWYKLGSGTPPRVNFGYSVQVKVDRRTGATAVSGPILWMHTNNLRFKGAITGYRTPWQIPTVGSLVFAKAAQIVGAGTLFDYDEGTGLWVNPRPASFTAIVADGGLQQIRLTKKTAWVEKPDAIGIHFHEEEPPPGAMPVYPLAGGSIKIK